MCTVRRERYSTLPRHSLRQQSVRDGVSLWVDYIDCTAM